MDLIDMTIFGFVCAIGGFAVGVVTAALVRSTDFNDWGDEDEHAAPLTGVRHDYASGKQFVGDGMGNEVEVTTFSDLPDYLKRQAE